jgi:hypothetical protein
MVYKGMFMAYVRTRFYLSISSGSLITTMKPIAKQKLNTSTMYFPWG